MTAKKAGHEPDHRGQRRRPGDARPELRAVPAGGQQESQDDPGTPGIRSPTERRAKKAGIGHVHAHLFRHSFAHRWLADGGNETDLMRLVGWRAREMLGRYGASAADERARAAYQTRSQGDRL